MENIYLEFYKQQTRKLHKDEVGEINLDDFLKLPFILQTEFLREISQKIPSMSELNDCLKWLTNKPDGNSTKQVGGTKLKLIKSKITW